MDTSQHAAEMPGSALSGASLLSRLRFLGQRRRFLLRGFHQGRAILWVCVLTLMCLCTLDYLIYDLQQIRSGQILQIAPELSRMIIAQDRRMMLFVYLGSFAALLVVVCITLFESHRTAGPLYNLCRGLERLGAQGPSVRIRFRKDDKFHRIETAFNSAVGVLEARTLEHAEEAHRLAADLKETAGRLARRPADAATISATLQQLAAPAERLEEHLKRV